MPVIVGETLTWGVSLVRGRASRSQLALFFILFIREKKVGFSDRNNERKRISV